MKRLSLALAISLAMTPLVQAQTYSDSGGTIAPARMPLAFVPNGNLASPLSVSNVSASVALPAGSTILVQNVGATAAYVSLSVGAGTATTSGVYIPSGASIGLRAGGNTYLNAITASSTTTINVSGGVGILAMAGGGGGSGGGGAITGPLGPSTAPSAAVSTTDTGTPITGQSLSAGGQGLTGWLSQLYAAAVGAIPAGTAIIGKVGIDQTTPGTTNLVATSAASGDPCNGSTAHASAAFAITSATQTSLVAAVSAKKIYICSITMITGAANNANFYDVASAGACSSAATDAVIGASSNAATNGLNFAANGGLTQGNGGGMLASTPTANSTLCVVTSSAGPFSGVLTYVQQ